MIFVAVGTQFPFDRLIKAVDIWVERNDIPAFAQIAEGDYLPQHMQWDRFIDGQSYEQKAEEASVIVAHAGMGNIITACEKQVPIIVMNRQHKLGEHRNDHQAEGLEWMGKLSGVHTATDTMQLHSWLDQYQDLERPNLANNNRRASLIEFIDAHL